MRDAWIEMAWVMSCAAVIPSHPVRDAWIEMAFLGVSPLWGRRRIP